MQTQLRIYTIQPGAMDQWVYVWKNLVKPLRVEKGFKIEKAWKVNDTNQFVWVLSHDGPDSWQAYDQVYHESKNRQSLEPDPYRFIKDIQNRFLDQIE